MEICQPLDQTDHRGLFKQISSPLSNFFITGTQVNALTITPTKNVLSITNPPIPTAANGTFYQGATKPFSTLTTYPTSLVTPASTITQNDTYTTGIPSSYVENVSNPYGGVTGTSTQQWVGILLGLFIITFKQVRAAKL